ncbi:MAG TPA: indolepyruvate oxidoreductase subunit beta family protein [Thermodesulfobacteriota bacterium]|nr:indolepyruvate oxidoreductase subunit beta family protein [Thermodesulfobacteriota bacterium]
MSRKRKAAPEMEGKSDLIKIMVPAVGGQGGGVLTEWLVQAFFLEDYDVQGISLPGLSQRGGSTVYYLEAHPKPETDDRQIIFAQFPVPGEVDVIISQEFLELGRALQLGYGSDRTTIVTSTHRIYSTLEKLPIGSGIYSDENLRKIATAFSSKLIELNALQLAKDNGMDDLAVNAILFGALAASGSLPLSRESFVSSIEKVGVAAKTNLRGFEVGWNFASSSKAGDAGKKPVVWETFVRTRADRLEEYEREVYLGKVSRIETEFPKQLREILAESIYRLIDYQDEEYADRYIDDVREVFTLDESMKGNLKLTEHFARNLALLMSYEDGIRVAELKIKSDRFKRIKEEMRLRDDQVFKVIDYLKPDAEEIYGLLPNIVVAPFVRIVESSLFKKIWRRKRPVTFAQTPTTTSFSGFLRLWLMTKIKFMRPRSYRFKKERALMDKYKESTLYYAGLDYKLGSLVARSGSMVKGYGKVRRRTIKAFYRLMDNIIFPLSEFERDKRKNYDITLEVGEEALKLVSGESVEGIDKAEKLAREIMEQRAA